MTITDEQFEEAYATANPAQKYLCQEAGNELMLIAEKYGLGESSLYKPFAILIGDVVLGFYKAEDLPILLQKEFTLPKEKIDALFRDLMAFMNPLYDPAWQPPTTSTSDSDIDSLITETESAIATLPTIRTMNQAEPVYSSTQAALLREARGENVSPQEAAVTPSVPPAGAPASPSTPTPSWDSAR